MRDIYTDEILRRLKRRDHTAVPIHSHMQARARERQALMILIADGLVEEYEHRPLSTNGKPDMRYKPEIRVRATAAGKAFIDAMG